MDKSQSEAVAILTDDILRGCMLNRELSWLRFNERVLEEADTHVNPLFERCFFLSIFTSNLDEFYMIRVGGLCDHALNKTGVVDNKTGMNAAEQLALIYEYTIRLYINRDAVYHKLETELVKIGLAKLNPDKELEKKHQRLLSSYFEDQIQPLLAPQIIDQSHPFPHLENNRQIIAMSLETKNGKSVFGIIPVPYRADRMFFLSDNHYTLVEDVILHNCEKIFKHYNVVEKAIVCVTRNADIVAEEERFDEDEDFLEHMSKLLIKRRRLSPVRLEVRGDNCAKLVTYLQKKLSLSQAQTFYCASPLDMSHFTELRDKSPSHLRLIHGFAPFAPKVAQHMGVYGEALKRIRLGDLLLFHPFDGIQPFFNLIREAAADRHVLSIQITLYRIAERSKLVEHLIAAAENGKEVFVFIELRARMDEENNIGWAKRMEEAGCHVCYGPAGYKLHAKICLITRREGMRNEYVTHIGTGNYNEKTARLYTDVSIITVNEAIGRDALLFFNNLKIGVHDDQNEYKLLWVAPRGFKSELIARINREAALGSGGRITIKCNSLTDRDVIIALIKASLAGTKIDLIVRGICCLIAQKHGFTENIRVRSIVGRFLEHSRIYRFGTGGDRGMYIGSGDMMTRNTERRVELFAPVLDPKNKKRLSAMLDVILADNVKAREMNAKGHYKHVRPPEPTPGGPPAGESPAGGPSADETFANAASGANHGVKIIDCQRYFIEEATLYASDNSIIPHFSRHPAEQITGKIMSLLRRSRNALLPQRRSSSK